MDVMSELYSKLSTAAIGRTQGIENLRKRLAPWGLGVQFANASGTSTGVLTPLRREAITVVASLREASFLATRGTRPVLTQA